MADDFGSRLKAAVEQKGKKDLSQYSVSELFPPTTKAFTEPFPERGDLGQAIKDFNREEETDGNE